MAGVTSANIWWRNQEVGAQNMLSYQVVSLEVGATMSFEQRIGATRRLEQSFGTTMRFEQTTKQPGWSSEVDEATRLEKLQVVIATRWLFRLQQPGCRTTYIISREIKP